MASRRKRNFWFTLLGLMVLWSVAMQLNCFPMRTADEKWPAKMTEHGQKLPLRFSYIQATGYGTVHVVSVAQSDTLPVIMMVHGSPGSADAFLDYLGDTALTRRAQIIVPDRPGFGYTNFGMPEPSLDQQADAMEAVLDQLAPGKKALLVGHSLGAPVIVRTAMNHPERVLGLVLMGGSVDPDQEEHPWWQSAINVPPVKWMIPKSFWVSNYEIKALEGELRRIQPDWTKINCPVLLIHSQDDRLVPFANTDFAKRMLVSSPEVLTDFSPDGDHFTVWSRHDHTREMLLKILK